MKLREMTIKNFKSIEDATIEKIGDIDVFSGRNNSGKTAIFEALTILQNCKVYPKIDYTNIPSKLFTGKKFKDRTMTITLVFELDENERTDGIAKYTRHTTPSRKEELTETRFLQRIEYSFQSFRGTDRLGLSQIRITGTDNRFGVVVQRQNEKQFTVTNINHVLTDKDVLTSDALSSEGLTARGRVQLDLRQEHPLRESPGWNFPFEIFQDFIQSVYSFSPFRTSRLQMEAKTTRDLAVNGDNLVQRIFTVKQNEDENWRQLREFVKTALPGLGPLQSRTEENQTVTRLRDSKWNVEIDVHDMGSGIEQLLIMACVLISKSRNLILMETPEHHLHPGAQRTLLQFIRENLKNNQVLITTHSPVFLSQRDLPMHIVAKTSEGTQVRKIEELHDLAQALGELGSRNSDLLLADFVLFVEGPSDEKIFRTWAKTLGVDFDSRNIFCITIDGSRNFYYYANTNVLQRISQKSPIPHLLIIDKDEKSDITIQKVQKQVKDVHLLEQREIENYLLFPNYLLQAIRAKAEGNPEVLKKLENVQPKDIEQLITSKTEDLKNVVLLKRIGEEIGGTTFLQDDALKDLIQETKDLDLNTLASRPYELRELTNKVSDAVTETVNTKCSKDRIKEVVEQQVSILKEIWVAQKDEDKRKIVPGKAILRHVFGNFGLNYDNVKDGERIAKLMGKDKIQPEIKSIIEKLQQKIGQ